MILVAPPGALSCDPRVQVYGPGFSKILLGDDGGPVEKYLDIMADSVSQ
jgi:hypothetical protein